MTASVQESVAEARRRLQARYGKRLSCVVLYGSQARGEARPDSDVDVLVVLRGDFDLYDEIKRLTELQLDLFDAFGVDISFQPFSEAAYNHRQSPFMINVRREGLEV